MNKKKVLLVALAVFSSQQVLGAWTGSGAVRELSVFSGAQENIVRVTHDSMVNPANCTNPGFLELRSGDLAFQEMYTVVVAAKTAGTKMNLQVSDTDCSPDGFPVVTQVSYPYTAGDGVVDALPLATSSLDGLMSAADKAKLDSLPAGPLQAGSEVAVLKGTVSNGGTIPLPLGFSESQCVWQVFFTHIPRDTCSIGSVPGLKVETSGRSVIIQDRIVDDGDSGCRSAGVSAAYINVCVK